MSQIVSTSLGRFRRWKADDGSEGFLFECPECKEWVPMSEDHLNGSIAPIHFRRVDGLITISHGMVCGYVEKHPYGATLVATMRAKLLMASDGEDVRPYDTDQASLVFGE